MKSSFSQECDVVHMLDPDLDAAAQAHPGTEILVRLHAAITKTEGCLVAYNMVKGEKG